MRRVNVQESDDRVADSGITDAIPIDSGTRLLVSVHGIRTLAEWQDKLAHVVQSALGDSVSVFKYTYGYFDILQLLVPSYRQKKINHFRETLVSLVSSRHWSRVDIIAHSFGTYLVAHALLDYPTSTSCIFHTIIFSGSVLPRDFPVHKLVTTKVKRIINDCGTKDIPLLLSNLFVIGLGMSGRSGIDAMENETTFCNRYFAFGHGGYFTHSTLDGPSFMAEYWLPLLGPTETLVGHDERHLRPWSRIQQTVLNHFELPKLIGYYAIPFTIAFFSITNYLARQEQTNLALSRQVAFKSASLLDDRKDLTLSTLLAVQTTNFSPTLESDRALRNAYKLLLRRLWTKSQEAKLETSAFSPDGKYFVRIGSGQPAFLYDAATGVQIKEMHPSSLMKAIAFSADSSLLIMEGADYSSMLFRCPSGEILGIIPPPRFVEKPAPIFAVAINTITNRLLVSGGDQRVRVFDLKRLRQLSEITLPYYASAASFSPSGKFIQIRSPQLDWQLFDAVSKKQADLPIAKLPIKLMAFSPDERILAVAGNQSDLQVVDLSTRKTIAHLSSSVKVVASAFSDDGLRLAAVSEDGTIRVYDARTLTVLSDIDLHMPVNAMQFSRDVRYAVEAKESGGTIYETESGHEIGRYDSPKGPNQLSFGVDAAHVVVMRSHDMLGLTTERPLFRRQLNPQRLVYVALDSQDRFVIARDLGETVIREVSTGRLVSKLESHATFFGGRFSPDGRYVTMMEDGRTATEFEVATGKLVAHFAPGIVFTIVYSYDSKRLAVSCTRNLSWEGRSNTWSSVYVYDADSGKEVAVTEKIGPVITMDFSKNGKWLAVGGADTRTNSEGDLRVVPDTWILDASSGTRLVQLETAGEPGDISLSADGRFVVTGSRGDVSDGSVQVFDARTGKEIRRWTSLNSVYSVAISPDDQYVAYSTADDKISRVFEKTTGVQISEIADDGPATITFSTDGKALLAEVYSATGVVRTTNLLDASELSKQACSLLSRNLTVDEWGRYVGTDKSYRETCAAR